MIDLTQEHLLDDGEAITYTIRKHWIVYVQDVLLHSVGCVLFLVGAYFLVSQGVLEASFSHESTYGAMILVMFVLLFWTSFFYAWTKDYFDVWYATTKHIIAITQKDIFNRDEAFMELNRIQDVFFEKDGFIATLLGYGKLKVQSAGTEQEFIIENVADVETVAHTIMQLRDEVQGKTTTLQSSL
jgi:uncharacterized membrane protein YdbT with pleckstrin-like domain